MDHAGPVLLSKKKFEESIKEYLLDSLLQNSFSTERPVFVMSFGIIVSLIINFRDSLKSAIALFLENIFLKLLESNNSSFHHRKYALHAFHRIFQITRASLELYVNYDCSFDEVY